MNDSLNHSRDSSSKIMSFHSSPVLILCSYNGCQQSSMLSMWLSAFFKVSSFAFCRRLKWHNGNKWKVSNPVIQVKTEHGRNAILMTPKRHRHTKINSVSFSKCFLAALGVPVIAIEGKKMLAWIMHKAQRTLHYIWRLKSRHTISHPFHFQACHFFHLLTACWWIKYAPRFSHMLICWMHMKCRSSASERRISIETWKPTAVRR